jgi:hypothetical protein
MPLICRAITARTVADLTGGDRSVASNTYVRDSAQPGFANLLGRTRSSYVVEARQ